SFVQRNGIDGTATYTWQIELINGEPTGNKTVEVRTNYQAPVNEIFIQGTREELFSDITFDFEYENSGGNDDTTVDANIVHLGDSIIMGYGRTVTVPSVIDSNL